MLHQTRDQRLIVNAVQSLEVLMVNEGQQRKVTRRIFAKVAGAGVAAAALTTKGWHASAAPASSSRRVTAYQDKPFAGKTLVLSGPAYWAPHFPDVILKMFEEQTGAKTEFAQFPAAEYDVKYSSLLVAEDSSVDVMYQWEAVIGKYGPVLLEDITGKVSQPILDDTVAAAQAAVMWQGKQYGVPFDSNMAIFLWNTDLYTAAGLDPATPPQNWTEFLEFSTKLTSGDTYGTMIPPEFFHYAVMINSTGGPALSPDLKTVLADTPESQLALQSMSDLFASGANDPISLTVPNSIEQGKNFRAGRFGHYFGFPNHFNLAQDPTQSQVVGKVAHGIIPGISLRSGTGNGVEGCAINRFSKQKDMALAFLEFTMSADIQDYIGVTWGRPPASITALDNPEVLAASPQFESVKEQAQYTATRYGSPFYDDLNKLYTEEMLKMANGDQNAADTATAIQPKAQQIVDDYWASVE